MASTFKYIADGFREDAWTLLSDFIDRSTVDFSEFADIWKKHYFSLIFMGRPDHTETSEFINETFRITTQFLSSPSYYAKVGAVYLLYSLYRNQISVPTVKVRIELNHWRTMRALLREAISKKYSSLVYVIDDLMKNGVVCVFLSTLKGPLIGNMQKISKNHETVCNIRTTYKSDIMQYSIGNRLETLRDLHAQYLAEKKNISNEVKLNLNPSHEKYEKFISDLREVVEPKKKDSESLGSRRAKLKAQSFMRKTRDRFGDRTDIGDDDVTSDRDDNFETCTRRIARPRRVPKHERRVGRPSKNPKKEVPKPKSDDEIDISHLLPQQQDFYLPPVESEYRKSRTRRDPYYKVSPKREEDSSSDADNPM